MKTEPIRKVSSGKFPVKFRVKGEPDGPVYLGQQIIAPCPTCPKPRPPQADKTSSL